MYSELRSYIQNIKREVSEIAQSRQAQLNKLADYLRDNKEAKLTFICTHNSRRSHLCQIWAATLAAYFGLDGVETYSGGTEATAFNPRAVEAIRRAGFTVEDPGGENPRYKVFYDEQEDPLICYSKTFDDDKNPTKDFVAVMTCTDADENCPVVPGAEKRFSIPYIDPKKSDGTPHEKETYDERCRQIAAEMYYLMSKV